MNLFHCESLMIYPHNQYNPKALKQIECSKHSPAVYGRHRKPFKLKDKACYVHHLFV